MESSSDHSQQRGPAQNPGGQESGSAYQGAGQPQKIVIEQPGGWFGRLGKLLWIALLISLLFNISQYASRQSYYATEANLQEKFYSGSQTAGDKIAILSLEGVIAEGNGFLKRQIDQVRKDDSVKALVLRVNSPGGTVAGSDYLYHHLKKLIQERELPLVVSMGPVCASGGYYISMAVGDQANSIFAEPTTATGSAW